MTAVVPSLRVSAYAGVHHDRKYETAMLDPPLVDPLLVSGSCSTPENESLQRNDDRGRRHVAHIAQRPHARAAADCAAQVCAGLAALT